MEFINMLAHRRSIRKYTDEAIPEEKLEKIIQAGLLSFAGKGLNPWEMIVVRDKDMLKKMSGCRTGCGSSRCGRKSA